jgi:hypothetical protein
MYTIMNWYRPSGRKLKLTDIPNKTYGQLVGDRDCYDTFVIVREYSSYNNNQQNYNDGGFEVICPRMKISYDNSGRKTIEYGNDLFTTPVNIVWPDDPKYYHDRKYHSNYSESHWYCKTHGDNCNYDQQANELYDKTFQAFPDIEYTCVFIDNDNPMRPRILNEDEIETNRNPAIMNGYSLAH